MLKELRKKVRDDVIVLYLDQHFYVLLIEVTYFQIQNALENKIASLVSTLQLADSAEKDFLKKQAQSKTGDTAMLEALNTVAENLRELQLKHCCQVFLYNSAEIHPHYSIPNFNPDKYNSCLQVTFNIERSGKLQNSAMMEGKE